MTPIGETPDYGYGIPLSTEKVLAAAAKALFDEMDFCRSPAALWTARSWESSVTRRI